MTLEIILVFVIIAVAVILFVSDKLRVDLVALMVLAALVLTGLITPVDALSGFSNPAVITVWAVFILSGALSRTGVANIIGNQVMRVAGDGQFRLLFLIMFTAAILSAFMNNVGVAALLFPVVMEIARRTETPPSKLLMPLAFGALLGGLTTLIGTPPNILASDALRDNGLEPFGLFDFAPLGIVIMLAGLIFMVLVGQRLLPKRDTARDLNSSNNNDLDDYYRLQEQMLVLRIPEESQLSCMSLAESQLGSMLGLNVIAIIHNGRTQLSPGAENKLQAGDRLLVVGEKERLAQLRQHQVDTKERLPLTVERVQAAGIELVEANLTNDSPLIGQTLLEADFRGRFGLNVLAIRRNETIVRFNLLSEELQSGDTLLVQGSPDHVDRLRDTNEFQIFDAGAADVIQLHKRLLLVCIPPDSNLVGRTLIDSQLGAAFGLTVLRIVRGEETLVLPGANEVVMAGDILLVQGSEEDLAALRGLEELEFDETSPTVKDLETEGIGMAEAVLSPHTTLVGKTLGGLRFRDKYDLNVLAIWRGGTAYRHNLRDMQLRFGDALLLYGSRDNFKLLGSDPDFVVLTEEAQVPPRTKKAPIAVAIMAGVLLTVLFGWLPIAIAAVVGGTLMVLSGSLTMDEAYRYIEWPAVFLIAAMLPLGIALQNSGAAQLLANGMVSFVGDMGPLVVLAGLFILSVLASQVMPNPAVVVLMAPIAIATATDLDVSPQAFMMGIAIAASASFLSPVSHPANVLVMGPGGYRFSDYIKVGLPLTLLVFIIVLLLLPLVWPF